MNIEEFREYCLLKPLTTEELSFGPDVLVFKVFGKMFALCDIAEFESINLKCDPEKAIEYRELYPTIKPGYHMNKKYWNTVMVEGTEDCFMKQLVDHSYEEVAKNLPKKIREILQNNK